MSDGFDIDPSPIIAESGIRKYMTLVFNKMFAALGLTGLISLICVMNPKIMEFMTGGFAMLLMFATIGIVMYISARINSMNAERASTLFWIYSALIGASISPMFIIYTGESIATSFLMSALFFGGMSLYGRLTKKDLTGLGSFMTVGLIAVLITMVANIFMGSSRLELGLSALMVIIFCGLTAYDVQKIARFYSSEDSEEIIKKKAVLGALSLYLDFINIFLALLRIIGRRR